VAEQEDRSTEDLSDEISQHRLEEYRRKGMVSQSREVTGLVALLAAGVATYSMSPKMGVDIAEYMREVFRTDLSSRMDLGSMNVLHNILMRGLEITIGIALPIGLAGFLIGALGSFAQIGSIFSFDPLTPDLNKINPLEGAKRLFSMKHAMESLRTLIKAIVAMAVCYFLVKKQILSSNMWMGTEPQSLLGAYGEAGKGIFLALIGTLAVFAGADYFLQRHEHNKSLRLTKEEAKQEHKEREGDPQIKARIRAVQRDMARKRMMAAVKKADVIVTNPTHIAVAIVYDRENMAAPKVVAKGADFIAQRIKKIAAESGVPMVENVPLARTLYKTVKIGQYIPRALYQAVAEVLAYVYRLKGQKGRS
jgi:flagellar biosynthetic protein FlhB